jgi:hypothetical protein
MIWWHSVVSLGQWNWEPWMREDDTRLNRIFDRIIGCAFGVMNTLGCGFLEKGYENALAHELR